MQIITCKFCKEQVKTNTVHNCSSYQRFSSIKDHYFGNNLSELLKMIILLMIFLN
jgi:hypothetical protein